MLVDFQLNCLHCSTLVYTHIFITVSLQQDNDDESVLNGTVASTTRDDADFVRHNNNSDANPSSARNLWQDQSLIATQRAQATQVSCLYKFNKPISYQRLTYRIVVLAFEDQIWSALVVNSAQRFIDITETQYETLMR
jgi:hypothetical protein